MKLTVELAKRIGDKLNINWNAITPDSLASGARQEMEHGDVFPDKGNTTRNFVIACKIALTHLKERPDYYMQLTDMERRPIKKMGEVEIKRQEYKEVIESLVEEVLAEIHFPPKSLDYNKMQDADGFWNQSIKEAADSAGLHPIGAPFRRVADVILWLNTAAMDWERRAKSLGHK